MFKEVTKTLAVLIAVFGITAFGVKANASDLNHDYTACKKVAKETFGAESIVKLHKAKSKSLKLKVAPPGVKGFFVTCDRETLALVNGK